MGAIWDISADVHGNIHVTDNTNCLIQVFSASGVFLCSFGSDKLYGPCSVCVSGQYVYVCDGNMHCVSVFTTAGVYVTSFGECGREEGSFYGPYYSYIDSNGFLYVCDYLNSRIQCF